MPTERRDQTTRSATRGRRPGFMLAWTAGLAWQVCLTPVWAVSPPGDDPDAAALPGALQTPAPDRRIGVTPAPTTPPEPEVTPEPQDPPVPAEPAAPIAPALPDEPAVEPQTLVASGAPRVVNTPLDQGDAPSDAFVWPAFLSGWKRRVEIGAFGATGNTSTESFRGTFRTSRKTPENETTINLSYQYATRESSVTQNRFVMTTRYDKLKKDSKWRYFLTNSYETDEFRDWDYRVTGGGGFGYQLIKDDKTSLLSRGGLSLAQDYGGLNEDLRTEAILGLDLTHKINDRQKISGRIDYLPNVNSPSEYRLNAKADWEFLIDPQTHLSLRVGAEDRFDSDARGRSRKNDINYYIVLAIEF